MSNLIADDQDGDRYEAGIEAEWQEQLGLSLRMFFEVYAKWISSVDDRFEMAKVDEAMRQKFQNDSTSSGSPDKEE